MCQSHILRRVGSTLVAVSHNRRPVILCSVWESHEVRNELAAQRSIVYISSSLWSTLKAAPGSTCVAAAIATRS